MIGALIIILVGICVLVKIHKEGKEIGQLKECNTTEDLRITSNSFSYIFLNLSSGSYDYCMFSKTEEGPIILRLRYSFPKNIYQKWMTLGFDNDWKLTHFKIHKRELNQSEFKIKLKNFFSSYSINIEIENNVQYETIKNIFC